MELIDLLRQVGLNQYEAEAFSTLLVQGPLTGYELGKRSGVPLSRSYDVLDRLTARGLAVVQPGDPPRYNVQPPQQFLAQVQLRMATTVEGLAAAFADLPAADQSNEFWVVRGRPAILARAVALVAGAQESVRVSSTAGVPDLVGALAAARTRGCRVHSQLFAPTDGIAVLADGWEALLGLLTPATDCQAVVSRNPALTRALTALLHGRTPDLLPRNLTAPSPPLATPLDWMAWEEHKQRQIWPGGNRVA